MHLRKITQHLDNLFPNIKDSSYNGLQVEASEEIQNILCTTDAGLQTFKLAKKNKCQLIIVHHGIFWQHANPSITGFHKERIEFLLKNKISLYAMHLPLDHHPQLGNNAQLLKLLKAKPKDGFLYEGDHPIGYIGETEKNLSLKEIERLFKSKLNSKPKSLPFGPKQIKRIAVCSGGGAYKGIDEAIQKKADLFITGDTAELYQHAKDAKINLMFAGHHATEILGVKAIAKHLKEKLKVNAMWIDIDTKL